LKVGRTAMDKFRQSYIGGEWVIISIM
jgi:hypothetical protein